jgi:hypothetical protein
MKFLRLIKVRFIILTTTCLFGSSILALAGTSPGEINCSKDDFSFEGTVPGDSIEINAKVKIKSNSIVLVDEQTKEMKGIPSKLVEIGDYKNPFDGSYLLKVMDSKDKKNYLTIIGSKKPVKFSFSKKTEFTFPTAIEFVLNELNKGKKTILKDVDCTWTYEDP